MSSSDKALDLWQLILKFESAVRIDERSGEFDADHQKEAHQYCLACRRALRKTLGEATIFMERVYKPGEK